MTISHHALQTLIKTRVIGSFSGSKRHLATESDIMQQPQHRKTSTKLTLAIPASALSIAALLTGCGTGSLPGGSTTSNPIVPATAVHAIGKVYGGQQAVTGSLLQIYTVGTTGLKSASTPLISATLTTSDGTGTADSNANPGNANNTLPAGFFTIPNGDYSCTGTTPGTEVYIVATGGNPGSGNNANLSLIAALGSCATLLANANTTTVNINEITTVAAAYALAPFATDYAHIGASGSNPVGLVNAFANAASLANTSNGAPGGASLPVGTIAPVSELNTLGNVLASCVNSTGAATPACSILFANTGATDTFGAGVAIAKNPGASTITGLYSLSNSTAPFQPSMSVQPNDFTVALSYNAGGGLATPYGIAIDASGNAWITNETGTTVTELSPTGSVLATPTATGLVGAQGIALDDASNVWVANTAGNSIVKFTLTSGAVTNTNVFTAGGIDGPTAIASDGTNVFVSNINGNSVTELNTSGTPSGASPITGSGITSPTGIAIGGNSADIYVTSGNGSVVHLSNSGVYKSTLTDNTLQGPMAVSYDLSSLHVFVSGSTTGTSVTGALSEFVDTNGSSSGTASTVSPVTSGLTSPSGIATDGTSAWVANSSTSGSLARFNYGSSTPASPATGFGSLNTPVGVAVDPSGSVWTTNSGSNTVSQFIGLAAPVSTPIAANVQ